MRAFLGVILVGNKYLKAADNLCERDSPVVFPFFHRLDVVNVDYKILLLALVVDFGLLSVSTRHGV